MLIGVDMIRQIPMAHSLIVEVLKGPTNALWYTIVDDGVILVIQDEEHVSELLKNIQAQ